MKIQIRSVLLCVYAPKAVHTHIARWVPTLARPAHLTSSCAKSQIFVGLGNIAGICCHRWRERDEERIFSMIVLAKFAFSRSRVKWPCWRGVGSWEWARRFRLASHRRQRNGDEKNSLPMYPTTRWHTLTPPHSLWLHASSLKDEENFRLLLREEMPERIRGGWVEWGVVRHKYTQQMELRFGGKWNIMKFHAGTTEKSMKQTQTTWTPIFYRCLSPAAIQDGLLA